MPSGEIEIESDADVFLSGTPMQSWAASESDMVTPEQAEEEGWDFESGWCVDEHIEGEDWLNMNRCREPWAGAYCSNIWLGDVKDDYLEEEHQ